MSKITKATFKSFLRKNEGNVYILTKSHFDGMCDGVVSTGEKEFSPLLKTDNAHNNNLGYHGVWLVGGSRDYFFEYEENGFKGIGVSNCCGRFVVAVKA